MTDLLKQHRLEAIRSLREEYRRFGDFECVGLCDRALAGDQAAYDEMVVVLTDTTFGGPSLEELNEFHTEIEK